MPPSWTLVVHTTCWHVDIEHELCAYMTGQDVLDSGDLIAACVQRFRTEIDPRTPLLRGMRDLFDDTRDTINDDDLGAPDACGRAYGGNDPLCCRDDVNAVHLFLDRVPTDEELAFLETRARAFPDAYRKLTRSKRWRKLAIEGLCLSDGRTWRRRCRSPGAWEAKTTR